jgi:hypothetical protein
MMKPTKLSKTLEASEPAEAEKIVERIKEEGEDSEYAELVKTMVDSLEEETVHQIKGYGGGDNERLWNAVGRLQAAATLRSWIFGRAADFNIDDEDEDDS